ncbi:pyruvate dehydrogenase E1 component alpha subunit [Nematocida sp. AWRm77]|nr:pyruvate dehydrogenase E1 component alpha subunit [Nematocida sp. AWRm77]
MCDLHLLAEHREKPVEEVSSEHAVRLCKEMARIRVMETVLSDLYLEKKIQGFCHLGIGQESIPVGVSVHLDPEDLVICSYRCHGYALVTGMDPKEIICEQVGSIDGCARGKGGSMHLYGPRFFGGHGIVGAQISLGIGLAFALKYRSLQADTPGASEGAQAQAGAGAGAGDGDKPVGLWTMQAWKKNTCRNVAVIFFGDGAANQGQMYESANMAVLWNLPVVFVCENNKYGMGTSVERINATSSFFNRFSFLPGIRADSTDVFHVSSVFEYARTHALTKGPILVEYTTYRYNGHSMTDAFSGYRTPQEVSTHQQHDPLEHIKQHLGPDSNRVYSKIFEEAQKEMGTIKEIALNSQRCPETELFTDILI